MSDTKEDLLMKVGTDRARRLSRACANACLMAIVLASPAWAQTSAGSGAVAPTTAAGTAPAATKPGVASKLAEPAKPAATAAASPLKATQTAKPAEPARPAEAAKAVEAAKTKPAEAAKPQEAAKPAAATALSGPGIWPAPQKLSYGFGSWPPDLSTHGAQIQNLYDGIFAVTGLTFLVTEGLLLFFLWKYRDRPGHKAIYSHGNTALEIGWTLLPIVIFVTLGISSADLWARLKDRSKFPQDAFRVRVTGRQFEWVIRYPDKDGSYDTEDAYETINDLHVPYGRPVRVELSSFDVIHSFFLPELRVKQDAVPGMQTEVWFQATGPANTEIACAELCGLGHYRMRGKVTIESLPQVQQWLKNEKENE